jgi:hypothetical protein
MLPQTATEMHRPDLVSDLVEASVSRGDEIPAKSGSEIVIGIDVD